MIDTSTSVYYVWVTSISEAYAEQLAGRLVSHGWSVAPLSTKLYLQHEDKSSFAVIALRLTKTGSTKKGSLMTELKETMKLMGMTWVSIIVSEPADCTWDLGKIQLPKQEQVVEEEKIIH